ncbi:MAG: endonuclease domain-containing protein [Actinomycetota bacterium]|nr:endonuclease domain-containing protein [Actinomycetota bacterium]
MTRAQLLELGLGAEAIKHRVRTGRLHGEHRGVYSIGRPARTALERASAAVLACGPGALLSHESALALWELHLRGWPHRMEVTVTGDRRHRNIRIHRCTTLSRRDVRRRHGIRVTSPARALLECAPRLEERALTRAVNAALRSPHCQPQDLVELLSRCPNHPGAAALRAFVSLDGGPTRSELEDAFRAFCEQFGLPRPRVNTRVGRYEVDAYFEAARVIVELDGWDFHRDRHAFERDRERDADALAAGIETVRITWGRLHGQPEREAVRLRQILAAREPSPSRPG